ncbi:MAG: toll/interleukin-1 receptor domain-containing protein [bacterium]|nr:toll/interleukin-1 receptor domain-containing protein [bacterium]
MAAMQHHVFLSHSKKDRAYMEQVRDHLHASGLSVWVDESGLPPGDSSWRRSIAKAITESGCLVVLCSPDANESQWVQREIEYAEELGRKIFPALLRGTPTDSIPFGYTGAQRVELDNPATYTAEMARLVKAIRDHLRIAAPQTPSAAPTPLSPQPPYPVDLPRRVPMPEPLYIDHNTGQVEYGETPTVPDSGYSFSLAESRLQRLRQNAHLIGKGDAEPAPRPSTLEKLRRWLALTNTGDANVNRARRAFVLMAIPHAVALFAATLRGELPVGMFAFWLLPLVALVYFQAWFVEWQLLHPRHPFRSWGILLIGVLTFAYTFILFIELPVVGDPGLFLGAAFYTTLLHGALCALLLGSTFPLRREARLISRSGVYGSAAAAGGAFGSIAGYVVGDILSFRLFYVAYFVSGVNGTSDLLVIVPLTLGITLLTLIHRRDHLPPMWIAVVLVGMYTAAFVLGALLPT